MSDKTCVNNELPVIFLDFDGVTHPDPCFDDNLFCRLPLIEEVLLEFPGVGIVISSSWREYHPISEMREYFTAAIQPRILGATPSLGQPTSDWLPGSLPQFQRQWECASWMKANRRWDTPWLAIDDRADWFQPGCANLLVTQSRLGFCRDDQARLRQMLRNWP